MSKFYLFLWLRWVFYVTLHSIFLAFVLCFFIVLYLYIYKNSPPLTNEVLSALYDLCIFWFPIAWSLTILIALFRSLKFIFNIPLGGYELKLYECNSKELIENIGYGDLIKVWRRWFMLLIWLVLIEMILAFLFMYTFTNSTSIYEWLNIYYLYIFILIAGYFSFVLIGGRCKKVKIVKC